MVLVFDGGCRAGGQLAGDFRHGAVEGIEEPRHVIGARFGTDQHHVVKRRDDDAAVQAIELQGMLGLGVGKK